jgi:hypothetical protein
MSGGALLARGAAPALDGADTAHFSVFSSGERGARLGPTALPRTTVAPQ